MITLVLQERCAGVDTISLVARILHRSKAHLQSMLLQNNAAIVEDFYAHLVCLFNISLCIWHIPLLLPFEIGLGGPGSGES